MPVFIVRSSFRESLSDGRRVARVDARGHKPEPGSTDQRPDRPVDMPNAGWPRIYSWALLRARFLGLFARLERDGQGASRMPSAPAGAKPQRGATWTTGLEAVLAGQGAQRHRHRRLRQHPADRGDRPAERHTAHGPGRHLTRPVPALEPLDLARGRVHPDPQLGRRRCRPRMARHRRRPAVGLGDTRPRARSSGWAGTGSCPGRRLGPLAVRRAAGPGGPRGRPGAAGVCRGAEWCCAP